MDTFERVKKCIASSLGVREEIITLDTAFSDLLRHPAPESLTVEEAADSHVGHIGPDSLALIELMMALEEEFNIEIPDSYVGSAPGLLFDKNATVQQVVDFIEEIQ